MSTWTRESILAHLDSMDESDNSPMTPAQYNKEAYLRSVIDDLLAERRALLAQCQPASTWRLPDWLGGHDVHIDQDTGMGKVIVWVTDHESTPIEISRNNLVEVRPLSIYDPVDLPLIIKQESIPERTLHLGVRSGHTVLDITADGETVLRRIILDGNDLRLLARAAWQRANAVEGDESS